MARPTTNGTVTVASAAAPSISTVTLVNAAIVLNGTGNTSGNGALVNSNLTSTAVLNAPSGVLAALVTTPFTASTIDGSLASATRERRQRQRGNAAVPSLGVTAAYLHGYPRHQKYTVPPTVTISGGGGSNAIAHADPRCQW